MKTLKCLLLVAGVVLSLVGCQKAVDVSFDSTVQEMDAQGGSVEVALKSNGEWTLSSSAEWLVVTPLSGNGNATITLTCESNSTHEARSAVITASSKDNSATLTVTQSEFQYYLNVTPNEIRCGSEGGEFIVQVSSNIAWTVSTPQWITSSVAQGSNDATVTLTVSAINGDFSEFRDVEVLFGNLITFDKVHVVQTTDSVPGITISPMSLGFACTGETNSVSVTTEDGWTAATSEDWISLSQTEGHGNAEVSVTVNENPEYVQRQGVVVFTTAGGINATLMVTQEPSPDPHFLEVSPLSFHFGKEGGEAEITIGCDSDWFFDLDSDWVSVSQQAGSGNAVVSLVVEPNLLMFSRSLVGIIKSGSLSYEISVDQEAGDEPVLASFTIDTLFVAYIGGLEHLELTSNTSWTLQASSWISLITSSGEGDASFDIVVNSNSNPEERLGFVNILHEGQIVDALVVVQEGRQDILEIDIAELDVRPEGGDFTVHITSNLSWMVNMDVNWLHCSPMSGFGPKDLTITVDAMSGSRPRTGHIKISGSNGAEVTLLVNQQ